jgi:2,3-dihydroxy-p-cumate/2,3-dihydroxybenzoate 3,4-dioxygenase
MIRYKKLGYVVFNVTDLEKSIEFYDKIAGMSLVECKNETAYLRCSRDHHNLILEESFEAGLKRVAFELESAKQFDIAFEQLVKKGLNPVELSADETKNLAQGRTLRFKDPVLGVTYEMYIEMMQLGTPYIPKDTQIERLGHVVFETNKFDELLDFFVNKLDLVVSDFSGREVGWAWLRAFPNPLHHSIGITKGKENKLNHLAYNVVEVDDIGKQLVKLKDNNVPILFGPGRHHPSGSIFLYFADPDGLSIEYSHGMEEFPEEGAREPRRLEPSKETLDEWGGTPGPDFGKYGKLIVDYDMSISK